MDRQSPTSIRYSYSNSSATDSIGISRSLEQSSHYTSNTVTLSARVPIYNPYSGSQQQGEVIPERQSESQSSSIPSQYMNQSSTIEIQRSTTVLASTSQAQPNQLPPNSAPFPPQSPLSSFERQSYQMQINELKLLLHQQTKQIQQKEQLQAKYERCIQQMNTLYQQNDELRSMFTQQTGKQFGNNFSSVDVSRSFMENSGLDKIKQEQIRRLKDSVLVLQKEKDSYMEETNQMQAKLNQIEAKNDQYENKLVLVSHELERLNRMIKQKNQQKLKISRQNENLHNEVTGLRFQLQRLQSLKHTEQSQKSAQQAKKMQDLYTQIQILSKQKVGLEQQIQRTASEWRARNQQISMQSQKHRLQYNTLKREYEDLEQKNNRLQSELKFLSDKNNSSQMQLSTVSTETNKLQDIIRQLEDKLRMLDRQYHLEVQKISGFDLENRELRDRLRIVEDELTRSRKQAQKTQNQSIQLRRKLQQISLTSERQTSNLAQHLRQRQLALRQLDRISAQTKSRTLQLQQNLSQQCQQKRQLAQKYNQLSQSLSNLQSQSSTTIFKLQSQLQQLMANLAETEGKFRQLEDAYDKSGRTCREVQGKLLSVTTQLQRMQVIHAGLVTQKNIDEVKLRQQLGRQMQQLQTRANNYSMQCNQMQQRQSNLSKTISQMTTTLHQKQTQNSSLQHQVSTLHSQLSNLQHQLSGQQQKNTFLQQSIISYKNQLQEQNRKYNEQTIVYQEQYQVQIREKESGMREVRDRLERENEELRRMVREKEGLVGEGFREVERMRGELTKMETQLIGVRGDFGNLVQELDYMKQTSAAKQKIYMQSREQMSVGLSQKQQILSKKTQQLWHMQSQLTTAIQKTQSQASTISALQQQTQQKEEKIKKVEQQYRNLQDQYNKAIQSINQIHSRSRNIEKQYSQTTHMLEAKLRQVQVEGAEVKAGGFRLEEQRRLLQAKLNDVQAQLDLVANKLNQANNIIQTKYKPLQNNYLILQSQKKSLQQIIRQQQTHIKAQHQKLLSAQQALQNIESQSIQQSTHHSHQLSLRLQQISSLKIQVSQYEHHLQSLNATNKQQHQAIINLQDTLQNKERQCQQYKESVNNISGRYRTLQNQYRIAKEQLGVLEGQHRDVQARAKGLEGQFGELKAVYGELGNRCVAMQRELLDTRQILRKTQEQRLFIQQQRDQLQNYYKQQLAQSNNESIALKSHIHSMQSQLHMLQQTTTNQSNSHSKTLTTLQQQLQSLSQTNRSYIQKIHQLTQDNVQLLSECERLDGLAKDREKRGTEMEKEVRQKIGDKDRRIGELENGVREREEVINQMQSHLRQMQSGIEERQAVIRDLQNVLGDRDRQIKNMETGVAGYVQKIDKLMGQINRMSEQLQISRIQKTKQLQITVTQKNSTIEHLHSQLHTLKSHHQTQLQNLQSELQQVHEALHKQKQGNKELLQRLEHLLTTDEQYFQQILHNLDTVMKFNHDIIGKVGMVESNLVGVVDRVGNRIGGELGQIGKEVRQWGEVGGRVEAVVNGIQHNLREREKADRKQQHNTLQRQQKLIKSLQNHTSQSTLQTQQTHNLISTLQSQQASLTKKMLDQLHNMHRNITQELENKFHGYHQQLYTMLEQKQQKDRMQWDQHKEREKEREGNMGVNLGRKVHEVTSGVLEKIQGLTRLVLENREEYRTSVEQLQSTIHRLQNQRSNLQAQISNLHNQSHRSQQSHLDTLHNLQQGHTEQLTKLQHTVQKLHKQLSTTNNNNKINMESNDHFLKQIRNLQVQLQRNHIQTQEMKRQYEIVVSQYQRTIGSLEGELKIARKQIDRMIGRESGEHGTGRTNSITKNSTLSSNGKSSGRQGSKSTTIQIMEQHNRQLVETTKKYETKINLLSNQIHRLQQLLEVPSSPSIQLLQLRHKLTLSTQQNSSLHLQIDRSMKTIQNLIQRVEMMKKSYNQMAKYAEDIQGKIMEMHGKYNMDLIKVGEVEGQRRRIDGQVLARLEVENRGLRDKMLSMQLNNQTLQKQLQTQTTLLNQLKQDNLNLRKSTYEYQLEFEKIRFLQQKIGILNNEVDRISKVNVQLNQEISECRFAIGDEAMLERRLMQACLTIVIMAAQIEALRGRLTDAKKENSRESRDSLRVVSPGKNGNVIAANQLGVTLNRVKSEQGLIRYLKSNQSSQSLTLNSPQQKQRDIKQFSFSQIPQKQIQIKYGSSVIKSRINRIEVPRVNRIDPKLSSMLGKSSRSRSGSKNKSPKHS